MPLENIDDLRILIHTARKGSLTAASQQLNITPAAASATLKRLEAQIGVRLFERTTRSMRLTAHGEVLLEHSLKAFDLIAQGEAHIVSERQDLAGPIRMVTPSDLPRGALLNWLNDFLSNHPQVQLSIAADDQPHLTPEDAFDLALRFGVLEDPNTVARRLTDTQMVVCAAPAYLAAHGWPDGPEQLAQHQCIMLKRHARAPAVWRFLRDGAWTAVPLTSSRWTDDAVTARFWALTGAGILRGTALELADDLAEGRLVAILTSWEMDACPLHAILPSNKFVPLRIRKLIDFLAEHFNDRTAVST